MSKLRHTLFTVEIDGSLSVSSSAAFQQQQATNQGRGVMAWWGVKWTRDGTAHQQNMGDLEVEKTILKRVCWRFHRKGWYIKTENNSVCFSVPSSSMTSILSPSTSWPTKRKPFSSKCLLSSGLTCSQKQGIHLDHRLSRWPYAKRLNAALWVQPWIGPLLICLSPTNSIQFPVSSLNT